MFTGIIEALATIADIKASGTNLTFTCHNPQIAAELKIDQSMAHNGVCLTVVDCTADTWKVTSVEETLQKTNLSSLQVGSIVNLERCLRLGDRLDGHLVQGHVDATATLNSAENKDGSWLLTFAFESKMPFPMVEKGSVCVNGISLTCFGITDISFQVAIIPYTWQHTNLSKLSVSDRVNIEFDILGKYITALYQKQQA